MLCCRLHMGRVECYKRLWSQARQRNQTKVYDLLPASSSKDRTAKARSLLILSRLGLRRARFRTRGYGAASSTRRLQNVSPGLFIGILRYDKTYHSDSHGCFSTEYFLLMLLFFFFCFKWSFHLSVSLYRGKICTNRPKLELNWEHVKKQLVHYSGCEKFGNTFFFSILSYVF